MRPLLLLAALAGLTACSANPEPQVAPSPPPEAVRAPDPPAPRGPCAKEACEAEGRAAEKAGDNARAGELYRAGCDQGAADACVALGVMVGGKDRDRAIELQLRACSLGSGNGCFNAAEKLRVGPRSREALELYAKACKGGGDAMLKDLACSRGALASYEARDYPRTRDLAQEICNDRAAGGCNLLGVMLAKGEGVAPDAARAAEFFARGCKGGDSDACDNQKKIAASSAGGGGLEVAGANIRMGSITADGFTMNDIACRVDGGGLAALMIGPAIAGGLAKKKAALDACAPKGAEVRVRWTMAGHRVTEVEARAGEKGDKKIEACVASAVKSSIAVTDATCAATFRVGRGR